MRLLKSVFSILGVLSPVHIHFVNMTSGAKLVGKDNLGNKYYRAKPRKGYKNERRWVMYNGRPEASKVPAEWHGWLHHQSDVFPSLEGDDSYRREWQSPYTSNQTGGDDAYMPPGHQLRGGKRDKASGDYEAWTPPK